MIAFTSIALKDPLTITVAATVDGDRYTADFRFDGESLVWRYVSNTLQRVPSPPSPPVFVLDPGDITLDISRGLQPVPPVTGAGDRGRACAFVTNTSVWPNGTTLKIIDELKTMVRKEVCVSDQPHVFVPAHPSLATPPDFPIDTTGEILVPWGYAPQPYRLNGDAVYYVNVREWKAAGDTSPRNPIFSPDPRSGVSFQLILT